MVRCEVALECYSNFSSLAELDANSVREVPRVRYESCVETCIALVVLIEIQLPPIAVSNAVVRFKRLVTTSYRTLLTHHDCVMINIICRMLRRRCEESARWASQTVMRGKR
jgi:hypothetical protein